MAALPTLLSLAQAMLDGLGGKLDLGGDGSKLSGIARSIGGKTGDLTLGDIGAAAVGYEGIQDADYPCIASDVYVAMESLTAQRTIVLPSAALYRRGQTLYVADESGACSATLQIVIAASNGETIAGQASVTMGSPYQKLAFHSNGSNLWTVA